MRRAVFFDVDGVLIKGYAARPDLRRPWDENLVADLGIDPDRFRERFIKGPFLETVITGHESLVNALERTLPDLGYTGSPLTIVEYWLRKDSMIDSETLDIAKALSEREDVALYVATNQEHLRAFHLWTQVGFERIFSEMFYSARLAVTKPDARFFEKVMDAIGPQQEPPLIIDDSKDVVEAAYAFGWEGVLFETHADCRNHPFIAARLS